MFLLEAHNALTLFENDIMPFAHSAVSLHFSNGEVVLVAEPNLVDPVLAGLDTNFADGPILIEYDLLIALVDARVASKR